MEPIKLNCFQVETLVKFLKDNISNISFKNLSKNQVSNLFLAYLKLEKAKEEWDKAMQYTE